MKKKQNDISKLFEFPKIKKRLFLKTLATLSFFFGVNFAYNKITYKKPLPYKDEQELPDEHNQNNNNFIENLEMQLALEAYDHLLNQLCLKASKLGVVIPKNSLIKLVSYDNMTSTIEVVLQDEKNTFLLKFPANNLSNLSLLEETTLPNQVSQLAMLLNSPLLEVPVVNSFDFALNKQLNTFVAGNINYYANSNMQFSNGNDRNEQMDNFLFAGRDYVFFNSYGKGYKNELPYDIVTIIAMTKDNYEILNQPDLLQYYLDNPQDSKFEINIFYQQSQHLFEKLNKEKQTNNILEK